METVLHRWLPTEQVLAKLPFLHLTLAFYVLAETVEQISCSNHQNWHGEERGGGLWFLCSSKDCLSVAKKLAAYSEERRSRYESSDQADRRIRRTRIARKLPLIRNKEGNPPRSPRWVKALFLK